MDDRQIYFDNDYSPELQRKRAQVRYVVKQLKDKNIKAKCMYPARLRMTVDSEEKTFQMVMDAALVLRDLKIQVDGESACLQRKTVGFSSPEMSGHVMEVRGFCFLFLSYFKTAWYSCE